MRWVRYGRRRNHQPVESAQPDRQTLITENTATLDSPAEVLARLAGVQDRVEAEVGKQIIGHRGTLHKLLVTLLANGHALLVGVPGLAKTLLVSTLAKALDLEFSRIQFTPDLMPSDITGTEVLREDPQTGRRSFQFLKGPVFANIILADEVNRTPPKTQAALLQAMQETEVTVGPETFALPQPFFVLATQNPIEQEGTYPLPEAQLDRFMFELRIGYPDADDEAAVAMLTTGSEPPEVHPAVTGAELANYQALVRAIPVAPSVVEYAVGLARSTRPGASRAPDFVRNMVAWGAGPRASQHMVLAAKARAALDGRPSPNLDDVRAVAPDVLRHRVVPGFEAEAEGVSADNIISRVIKGSAAG